MENRGKRLSLSYKKLKVNSCLTGNSKVRVAAAHTSSVNDISANFETCSRLVKEAAAAGAKLLCFPDNFSYFSAIDDDCMKISEPLGGPIMRRYCSLARESSIWLSLGGFQEKGTDDDSHFCSTQVIIDDTGKIINIFSKMVPYNIRNKSSIESPFGRLGFTVCDDLGSPELYRQLRLKDGIQVFLVPGTFCDAAQREVLLRARAIENQCYVIAASKARKNNEKIEKYGDTLIIDPCGNIIGRIPERLPVGITFADIDFSMLDSVRTKMPMLDARRRRKLLKDRFSELPDEIIVCILSFLTMKEAGKTSVLSKRWRYIWAYIPILDFDKDASSTFGTLGKRKWSWRLMEVEKHRYLRWVNQVVQSYKGPTIDEFKAKFDLDTTSSDDIDHWVKFAVEKRVKRLKLDFRTWNGNLQRSSYSFGHLPICESLTYLELVSVNITGNDLEKILKSCPYLEYLSVEVSRICGNLEVSGAALNLKYISIRSCFMVGEILIYAPNLVSFTYYGDIIVVPFKRFPKLSKLCLGGRYTRSLNFLEISSSLVQLEALSLMIGFEIELIAKYVDQFPLCKRLKELELMVNPGDDDVGKYLFCFAPMIKAFPFLHRLVLKIHGYITKSTRLPVKVEARPHYHLKIVEIVGFFEEATDSDFFTYLIESCVALEKIIIDFRRPFLVRDKIKASEEQVEKRLRAKLKPGTELILFGV